MIITIDAFWVFDNIHYPILIKIPNEIRIEGYFLNMINKVNVYLCKMRQFSYKPGRKISIIIFVN